MARRRMYGSATACIGKADWVLVMIPLRSSASCKANPLMIVATMPA